MKKLINLLLIIISLVACTSNEGPYNPSANARSDINQALTNAKAENMPTLIIFGANWCPDCRALADALANGKDAQKIALKFKVVKVNVGNFDANLDITEKYGNPISGGIPGAAVISSEGNLLYVTKPGQLNKIRNSDQLFEFFIQASSS